MDLVPLSPLERRATRPRAGRLALWLMLAMALPGWGFDLTQKSLSSSKQFLVYSTDVGLRRKVATFAEEVKGGFLQILGEPDRWRYPILITLERATTDQPGRAPFDFQVLQSEIGFKVEIDVRIGGDPTEVFLQKHLIRALYLEFAYRHSPEKFVDGHPYAEAPWWLVEGTIQAFRTREKGAEASLYRQIIDVNRLPSLEAFLTSHRDSLGGNFFDAVDRACAVGLLQLLLEQPNGRASLASYVRHLPSADPGDRLGALRRDFPTLGTSTAELQKWWTLNLARLAAADRYKGISPEETDAQLGGLLQFEIAGNKGAPHRTFGIADFQTYLKLEASRPVLAEKHTALLALSTKSNALYTEILADYEQIFSALIRGKTSGVRERLERLAATREFLLKRKSEIADYLNWFEATQMDVSSRTFESYMKLARELETAVPHRDPINRYLDKVAGGR